MRLLRLAAIVLCGLLAAVDAKAALTATLSASVKNSARGQEIVFSGTLTNTSATDKLFLNDVLPVLSGESATHLVLQSTSFFSNVPGILLPGESYTNSELFRISLSAGAPAADYGGSVIFRGGADIFANTDLASSTFSILSPAVSLLSSDASASELGPDPGAFTISRTGSTAIDLPVSLTISGTATNGVSYNGIVPALTIPAGSSSSTIVISPIPNNLADGDRSVVLSLAGSTTYNPGATLSDTVTLHDKPADAWRFENFGPGANDPAAADAADWEGDGIQNLLEFALALDPKASDRSGLPAAEIVADYLTISYVPNTAATDVNYIVEASTDLETWSAAGVEEVTVSNPIPPGRRTFRATTPLSQSEQAYLRLRVVRLNP